MIANNDFQAAVVSKLKANTALVNWLTARSAGNEVREASWQGAEFVFPAVRVQVGTQIPIGGDGVCHLTNTEIPFTMYSFTETDSSLEANALADLVNDALVGNRISGNGFGSLSIDSDGLTGATRTGERLWRAIGLYRVYVYETNT